MSTSTSTPEFWACWPRPTEVLDWHQWGFGFDDFEGWLARLGVKGVRVGCFSWNEIETSEGVYQFDTRACPLDDTINRLVKAGLSVYLNPQLPAPKWAMHPVPVGGVFGKPDARPLPPETLVPDAERFDGFVRELVARYGNTIRLYGWGNENDADSDPIGALKNSVFGGDWTVPAMVQYYQWSLPFARAVRSVISYATIVGPETMTYGYANTMLREDNRQPLAQRAFDIVSVHGYAMDGKFPEDALRRMTDIPGSLNDWMADGGALAGRSMMLGEMGIEKGENPRGLLTYLDDPRIQQFVLICWLGLDNWLTVRSKERPKALTPNALYAEVQAKVASQAAARRKPRAVRAVGGGA